MPSLDEPVAKAHRRAIRWCMVWLLATLSVGSALFLLSPIVGVPSIVAAAWVGSRTLAVVVRPHAYGAHHWRLVTRAFRGWTIALAALGVPAFLAIELSVLGDGPSSTLVGTFGAILAALLAYALMAALGTPQEVVREHALRPYLATRIGDGRGYEAGIILMRHAEDLDRLSIARFGETFVRRSIERARPPADPFDYDEPPETVLAKVRGLIELIEADGRGSTQVELLDALRSLAEVLQVAIERGIAFRMVATPEYPSAQALDLMGSPAGYW